MIEMIMYFGGGFLVASLLAIVLISFVHQRAVRLTQRRLADAIPVSMAEIQADKDHLRAEFALSARRLEMSVEQLKAKATAQLSDIARKTEAINLLKAELVEKTAVTDELSGKAKILGGKLTQAEQENLEKATALEATAQTVAAKDAEIANAANIIATLNHAADTQRVEVAVLNTQIEDLKSQIGDIQQATESTAQRLLSEQSTTAGVHKDLYQARQTIEMLHPQVARLEHELAAHANELENRASLIGELDARIAEQNRLLRQREAEAQDLHQELASTREDAAAAAERLRSARAAVETQLQTANDMLSERAGRIEDHERRISDFDRLVRQRDAEAHALSQEIATRQGRGERGAHPMGRRKIGVRGASCRQRPGAGGARRPHRGISSARWRISSGCSPSATPMPNRFTRRSRSCGKRQRPPPSCGCPRRPRSTGSSRWPTTPWPSAAGASRRSSAR